MNENKINIENWNAKVIKLQEYFENEFPDGCDNITFGDPVLHDRCPKSCVLYNEDAGTDWDGLCQIFIARSQDQ